MKPDFATSTCAPCGGACVIVYDFLMFLLLQIFAQYHERFEVAKCRVMGQELGLHHPRFTRKAHHTLYNVDYRQNPFGIVVTRKSTGRAM